MKKVRYDIHSKPKEPRVNTVKKKNRYDVKLEKMEKHHDAFDKLSREQLCKECDVKADEWPNLWHRISFWFKHFNNEVEYRKEQYGGELPEIAYYQLIERFYNRYRQRPRQCDPETSLYQVPEWTHKGELDTLKIAKQAKGLNRVIRVADNLREDLPLQISTAELLSDAKALLAKSTDCSIVDQELGKCPKCKGPIGSMFVACPRCGRDLTTREGATSEDTLEYSEQAGRFLNKR
jgi:hypothetical protein